MRQHRSRAAATPSAMRMMARTGRREPPTPGGEVDVEVGDEEVKVGVREVTGVAKDVVVG
jgi:hypothetical protein